MINYVVENHQAKSLTISHERFDSSVRITSHLVSLSLPSLKRLCAFVFFLTDMKPVIDATCDRISTVDPVKSFGM